MIESSTTKAGVRPNRFSPLLVLSVLCVGSLAGALMQSLVIPIQSELPKLLATDPGSASWAVTATLLAGGVSMPVTGRLADMYGKKKIMVVAAVVLVAGSVVAALSSVLVPFLIGRVLQGFAMGYIPVAISMVREVAKPSQQAGATAAVSATLGVGGALGLPLSAWIAQNYTWHWLFWLSAALAVLVLVLTMVVVPNVHDAHPGRIDVVGAVVLAVGLCAVLIGVSKGADWGWDDGKTVCSIVVGIVVLVQWGFYELQHGDPLVDLRTSARRPVLFTNLAAVLIGFGMMAQSIVVPQLLQMPTQTGYGLGQTILQAGLWMAPAGLMMMVFAPVSSRLITTVGARITLAIGAVVIAGGYLVALELMDAPWQLMVASLVASAGVGIGYAAMPTLILDNVPGSEAGSSVGLNALMRSIGTTVAGAVMTAILTSSTMPFAGTAIPDKGAFQICFLVGTAAALVGAVLVTFIPRQRKKAQQAAVAETPQENDLVTSAAG